MVFPVKPGVELLFPAGELPNAAVLFGISALSDKSSRFFLLFHDRSDYEPAHIGSKQIGGLRSALRASGWMPIGHLQQSDDDCRINHQNQSGTDFHD
jgi:hypothetical protein